MPTNIGHYIDGARSASASDRTAPSYSPATGEQSGLVALASAAETGAAIAVAKRAFPSWAGTPPLRRARILNRFLRDYAKNAQTLSPPSSQRNMGRSSLTRRAKFNAGWKSSNSRPASRNS